MSKTIGNPKITTLSLRRILNVGDQVKIRQLICSADEHTNNFTTPVVVVPYSSTKTSTKSATFKRNNCPPGQIGSAVEFKQTVTETRTSPFSQIDADQQAQVAADKSAQAAVDAGGQANANANGRCDTPPPPTPVLDTYDVNTFILKGKNFLPLKTVWVRVTVSGILNLTDEDGNVVRVSDFRTSFPFAQFTSDSSGNISARIVPQTTLPTLTDAYGVTLHGAAPGEQLIFTAHDGRLISGNPLWSNPLTVTA